VDDKLAYTRDDLRQKILGFIHSEIQDKTAPLAMDTPIEAVTIDSIDVIHVVFKVEEEFKTEVSLSNDVSYATVGEFVDALIAFVPREQIEDA
jgi:acyl carrier protein